jgi:hypothetical protein
MGSEHVVESGRSSLQIVLEEVGRGVEGLLREKRAGASAVSASTAAPSARR